MSADTKSTKGATVEPTPAPTVPPKTGAARLAEIHGRLMVVNRRIGKLQAERAALIEERNRLEAVAG